MKPIRKLPPEIRILLVLAVQVSQSYVPDKVMPHIEEALTDDEYQIAYPFLRWIWATGQTFDRDTIDARYEQFQMRHKVIPLRAKAAHG